MKTLNFHLVLLLLVATSCSPFFLSTPEPTPTPLPTPEPCLAGGDQSTINARLKGVGAEAVLCQGALFDLKAPVVLSAAAQKIYTEGFPEDDRRAMLRIASQNVTTAIKMRDHDAALISHIIIDGNRPELGYREGEALVFAGGNSTGQVIRSVKITEPRSWSALHLMEPCTQALVEKCEIGPAGMSNYTWADGISLACTDSIVRDNLIVDATDGGIVIFAAPGSLVEIILCAQKHALCWEEFCSENRTFTTGTSAAQSLETISLTHLALSSGLQ